jgi:hypothetical protein
MNPDGVSYLDMGDLYWRGNWHAALNAHWSPLYSWLTGLMFLMTKPNLHWEYPEVQLLNFVIFVATLSCFEFFWRELLSSSCNNTWVGDARPYAWALGYLLFAHVHLLVLQPETVSPDLLMAALVYVASGMILRFRAKPTGPAFAGLLGVVLGVGYLAKAPMLPFAVFVMMTMLVAAWRQHGVKWVIGLTLLGFLAVSLPFITALSNKEHRFTFGDSARLNQGWWVNGVRPLWCHWQGDRPGHEDAQHPTRKLSAWPEVYEFATPIEGTYPPWYDPSYWYAGLDSSVHPLREVTAFLRNADQIGKFFLMTSGVLTTVLLMMFLLSDSIRDSWRRLMNLWPILVLVIAVFLMYAMVFWQPRYTSGVMLLGCAAVMVSTSISNEESRMKVLRAASLVLLAMVVCWEPVMMLNSYRDERQYEQDVAVADRLRTLGIEPGDHVALIGDGLHESYWARLDKIRIVAEVPHNPENGDSTAAFWTSGPEREQVLLDILKRTGAKAVITDTLPGLLPSGWVQIGNTGRAVFFFQ